MGFTYPGYRTNFRANNFGLQLVPHNNAMEDWKLLLTADQKRERRIQSQNSFYITYTVFFISNGHWKKNLFKRKFFNMHCINEMHLN